MASFIFNKDQSKTHQALLNICENDNDLQYYPSNEHADIVTVSNEDFLKVKNCNSSIESYDGTNFTWFDHTASSPVPIEDRDKKEILADYLTSIKDQIDEWLKEFPSHAKTSEWQTYRDYCHNIDLDSLTFPLNKSWEQYCADNSVSYKNILELPSK